VLFRRPMLTSTCECDSAIFWKTAAMKFRRFAPLGLGPGFIALLVCTGCQDPESIAATDAPDKPFSPDASTFESTEGSVSATAPDSAEALNVDAASGRIRSCSAGWCAVTVGTAQYANAGIDGFTADGTHAYWTQTNGEGAGLFWLPLSGVTGGGLNNGSFEGVGVINANASGVFFFLNNFDAPHSGSNYTISQVVVGRSSHIPVAPMGSNATAGAIAGDGTNVYWIDAANLSLMKGTPGGGGVTTLVSGLGSTQGGLAVEGGNIYWADTSSIQMVSSAGQGGAATTFEAGQISPGFIAADANNVYWTTQGSLVRVPLGGGPLVTITSGQTFLYVAMGTRSFYWSTGTQIEEVPLAGVGSPATPLYTFATGAGEADEDPYGLAVSGNSLCWIGVHQSVLRSLTPE
jgi:hypothetical protein